MNKFTLFLIIVFALFLQSCRSTKKAVQPLVDVSAPISAIAKFESAEDVVLNSIQQRSNFDWFSANLSGSIVLDGDRNTFGGQIRIKNGEQIWMSITAMGGIVQVARLKITTDSVFIYNLLERSATISDFGFFREMTGVDFTFDMLQDILVGNYFLPTPNSKNRYSYEFSEGNFLFANNRMVENVALDFALHNAHYKFVSLVMRDVQNRTVRVDYDGYAIFNDNLYAQNLFIQMKEPMAIELKLNYQKIQINVPQNMQFSIPSSVKRN